jgi:ATP-dependent helicase HrpB
MRERRRDARRQARATPTSGAHHPSFATLHPPLGYLKALVSPPPLPDLPINEALPALALALASRRGVLLEAPPGAGKSTIVPLFLHASPWLEGQKILMLEPRRIAARAVAGRMAHLLGEPVGRSVGFRTRLETRVSRETSIEVVTEGILTRMLQEDSGLPGIGCVIFDEFHERSLNADLGLALCIESQQNLREDLRVVVMSATLDLEPIAKLLGDAPIVAARGRSFEVATQYVARRPEIYLEQQTAQVVRTALREHDGDILCFLPGAAEIRRVQRALEDGGLDRHVRVLPLFGELEGAAQDAALAPAPAGQRKIVLTTSIAETSLTIEGVRVVVDSGLRRYAEFDPATGMSHLVTTKVSQAAADQRRGRAGRLSSGHCYRLWSEGTQGSLAPQTAPEILHADLAPLALELSCWGAVDAASLSWLDPPPAAPLAQARDLLRQLEAIDSAARVTAHGRMLAKLGLHPRLAHMLVKAREHGAPRLACDLAAILSERDILRAGVGARDVDLRLRVAVLRGDVRDLPPGITVDSRAMSQAVRSSGHWQRDFTRGRPDSADPHEWTGILLAWAYPDRIGRARGDGGRYLLANGRGARFGEPQALAKAEFIVAAELDGAEREARIFLAAPLRHADLDKYFSAQILDHAEIVWDDREQAIRARRERRLGALILESTEIRNPDPQAVQNAALAGLRQLGLTGLPWTPELRQWQARVMLMQQYAVASPEPWPDLSDAALAATLEDWAPPWISGCTRREHFARMDLRNALRSRLSYAQGVILEREAPTHFTVPSGSAIPIDYLDGEIPTLSVRLQEMFGLNQTPSVAAGRLPLLLKLLSPARRPVQITRDLVSFWNRGYHEVKKDLKGRYPKHYWPEDPYTAEPTRRARPRSPPR